MALTEDEVREWRDGKERVFERAITEIGRLVEVFLIDWAEKWEFSYQVIEGARVKEAQRIHTKALRRGLDNPDQLLDRCYEKDGRDRFPVHDLLGVRVLVLSLNHMAALKQAVENLDTEEGRLYPFGNPQDFGLEDINESPRPGGYRALHIDGSVTVREGETDYTVPFEIQVKTLAQHVYGQHTHDEAYVPDDENEDPRYELVKGLQEALAEQLNAADLLLAQIEDVAVTVRDDIARRAAGPEVSPASVANAVREKFGRVLREADAQTLTDLAHGAGVDSSEAFAALIDPAGDEAAAVAETFRRDRDRSPTHKELVEGVLARVSGKTPAEAGPASAGAGVPIETPEDKARLDEALQVEPPASPLDQIDPDVELAEPEQAT